MLLRENEEQETIGWNVYPILEPKYYIARPIPCEIQTRVQNGEATSEVIPLGHNHWW